jgi:hypothetical protein
LLVQPGAVYLYKLTSIGVVFMADIPENVKQAALEACRPIEQPVTAASVGHDAITIGGAAAAGAAAGAAIGSIVPGAGTAFGAVIGAGAGAAAGAVAELFDKFTAAPDGNCVIEKLSTPSVKGTAQGQER